MKGICDRTEMSNDQQPPSPVTTGPRGLATRNESPNIQDAFRKNWPHCLPCLQNTTIATHLKLHARKRGSNMAMERGKQRMSKKCLSTKDVSSTILHCDRLESTTASLPFSPPCFHRNHHHQGYPMHPARALGFHQVQPGL